MKKVKTILSVVLSFLRIYFSNCFEYPVDYKLVANLNLIIKQPWVGSDYAVVSSLHHGLEYSCVFIGS